MNTIPKQIKRYCKPCNSSQIQNVDIVKPKKRRITCRDERRRLRKGKNNNLGKYSEPVPSRVKLSKKPFLIKTCSNCNKGSNIVYPRSKKIKIV